jgi:CCR4-NOT transcription complex subunit 3
LEAESELINAAKGKRGVKVDTDRLSEIEGYLERHKFHKVKLEAVLRNLENDNISTEDVETIKENVEYYIDSNQVILNDLVFSDWIIRNLISTKMKKCMTI